MIVWCARILQDFHKRTRVANKIYRLDLFIIAFSFDVMNVAFVVIFIDGCFCCRRYYYYYC